MFSQGGTGSTSIAPLSDTRVWHDGQIVALVVADSFEAAREAASLVEVGYAAETPSARLRRPRHHHRGRGQRVARSTRTRRSARPSRPMRPRR